MLGREPEHQTARPGGTRWHERLAPWAQARERRKRPHRFSCAAVSARLSVTSSRWTGSASPACTVCGGPAARRRVEEILDTIGAAARGVRTTAVGKALFPATMGWFDLGASSEMVLFIFVMSMIGSVSLIEARRLGVVRRMLATPTSATSIVLGQGIGRFAVAMLQGLVIMVGSALAFGVHWGDPLAAGAPLTVIALVGAGAGLLLGSTLRTEQQAVGVGLLAFAAVLLCLAAWRLRRVAAR